MGKPNASDYADKAAALRAALPMVAQTDPEAVAAERALLAELNEKPALARFGG